MFTTSALAKGALVSLLLCVAAYTTNAAEISIKTEPRLDETFIYVEGEIRLGDYEKFKTVAKDFLLQWEYFDERKGDPIRVQLNSTGGSVEEAIKIATLIRAIMGTTHIEGVNIVRPNQDFGSSTKSMERDKDKGLLFDIERNDTTAFTSRITKCYSACVLLFLSGVKRYANDNIDFRYSDFSSDLVSGMRVIPVIGLHRPYFESEMFATLPAAEANVLYKDLEKQVREFLTEMGASNELIERIMRTSSENIDFIEADELDKKSDFSRLFSSRDPFYEEWLIAKCKHIKKTVEEEEEYIRYRAALERAVENKLFSGPEDEFTPENWTVEQAKQVRARTWEHWHAKARCEKEALSERIYSVLFGKSAE